MYMCQLKHLERQIISKQIRNYDFSDQLGGHNISLELRVKKNFSTTLKIQLWTLRVSSLIHGVPATNYYSWSTPISAF